MIYLPLMFTIDDVSLMIYENIYITKFPAQSTVTILITYCTLFKVITPYYNIAIPIFSFMLVRGLKISEVQFRLSCFCNAIIYYKDI